MEYSGTLRLYEAVRLYEVREALEACRSRVSLSLVPVLLSLVPGLHCFTEFSTWFTLYFTEFSTCFTEY